MIHAAWLPVNAALAPFDLGWGAIASLLGVAIFAAVVLSIFYRSRTTAAAELRMFCRALGLSAGDRRVLARAAKACREPLLHPAALALSQGCFRFARTHTRLGPADIARLNTLEGRLFPSAAAVTAQRTETKRTVADRSEPRSTTAVRSAFSSSVR